MAEDPGFVLQLSEDRPLVTFALFSYNQEKFIRDAVCSALNQTYTPLEIIISDDCSTDGTYEIIKEIVSKYNGINKVIARKNTNNKGLIEHVNDVISLSSSDLIILSAGDDISDPKRTEKIIHVFKKYPEVNLVHSNIYLINEYCISIGNDEPPIKQSTPNLKDLALSSSIYIGATGAIRKNLYTIFGPITEKNTYEDLILGFRASLIGKLYHINEPLVRYRYNFGISSGFIKNKLSRRQKRLNYIKNQIATLVQRKKDLDCIYFNKYMTISKEIIKHIEYAKARLEFHENRKRFFRRLISKSIFSAIKAASSELKYILKLTN